MDATLSWRSLSDFARGEADGIFSGPRTGERQRICSFPDEPLAEEKRVFFVRAVDVGTLQFSSFEDLIGHQAAVPGIVPGLFEQSILPPAITTGMRDIAEMRLSGKIEPPMSSGVVEGGTFICFSRTRVSPAFIASFSQALKESKLTEAFQKLRWKYSLVP